MTETATTTNDKNANLVKARAARTRQKSLKQMSPEELIAMAHAKQADEASVVGNAEETAVALQEAIERVLGENGSPEDLAKVSELVVPFAKARRALWVKRGRRAILRGGTSGQDEAPVAPETEPEAPVEPATEPEAATDSKKSKKDKAPA